VPRSADVVIAGISGDPARQSIADVARALACAARVVRPQGRIALLCAAAPAVAPTSSRSAAPRRPTPCSLFLKEHAAPDMQAVFEWASAARQATIYLLSGLPDETAEELFAVPMDHARQVQRLVETVESCIVLPDAHKTMAVIRE